MTSRAIALDIGGTTIKSAFSDAQGALSDSRSVATPRGGDQVLAAVVAAVDGHRRALAERGDELRAIGLASPGLVHDRSGTVLFAANLGWRDLPLAAILAERFEVPVALDNDARAGAAAERAAGPADDLAFVPVGTGVSAAYFVAGQLVSGARDAAGEFGHLRVIPDGESCVCGGRGCVEAYASAASILGRYRALGGSAASTAELAVSPDPLARRVWSDGVEALAVGIASLTSLIDPARVVIGGGLSLAGEVLLAPVRARVSELLTWRPAPPIAASAHGAASALVGAGLLGWAAAR